MASDGRRQRGERILVGSLGALIQDYRQSAKFRKLKPATKTIYERAFGYLHPLYRVALKDIRRRHVRKLQDALQDRPALANQVVSVACTLMTRAVEDELIPYNPLLRIDRLKIGRYAPWSQAQIDFAMTVLPKGYCRAITVALYTGQREGDCLAMGWSDYDGDEIAVAQEKTDERLRIPCHAELRGAIETWKAEGRSSTTILADNRGRPYKASSFAPNFSRALRKHPELNGCTFHGLRVTAATRLAEAGCTAHEIMAITGHKTLAMVSHYTQAAEQRTRAKAAIIKLESASRR